jgi:predicted secreted protein
MARTGKSEGFIFIDKFRRFYPSLHEDGIIKHPTRDSFMEFLGLERNSWKKFDSTGIRRIYRAILELLEKAYPEC